VINETHIKGRLTAIFIPLAEQQVVSSIVAPVVRITSNDTISNNFQQESKNLKN
jgi:hypothetical protein